MDILKLEAWYLKNHRKLKFRETKNPYHIWVSEIMLQQTQVETVLPYFERFIQKYPTVEALALADEETLYKDIEGIGYYRRFRLMKKAAERIVEVHQGTFPSTYEDILNLPGIGLYTAGAIMSIAFQKPYSALDGNVIRVLTRYLGIDQDMRIEKNKKMLNVVNQTYIETARPEIYTQAMMELGAMVCKPKQPTCEICPLKVDCFAYLYHQTDRFPVLSKLKAKTDKDYITLVIEKDDHVYLRKRDEDLLKGMYEYPQYDHESIQSLLSDLEALDIILDVIEQKKVVTHVFTHQVWRMQVYHVRLLSGSDERWVAVHKSQLHTVPMAIAHRKIK